MERDTKGEDEFNKPRTNFTCRMSFTNKSKEEIADSGANIVHDYIGLVNGKENTNKIVFKEVIYSELSIDEMFGAS